MGICDSLYKLRDFPIRWSNSWWRAAVAKSPFGCTGGRAGEGATWVEGFHGTCGLREGEGVGECASARECRGCGDDGARALRIGDLARTGACGGSVV